VSNEIEYHSVDIAWVDRLALFFEILTTQGADKYFHPHPFDRTTAEKRGHYKGHDLYFVQTIGEEICGYGMLRGWDEGYSIPSLGIIVHPEYRGKGVGKNFLLFLHEQAKEKGAEKIRLKVYPENSLAIRLYEKFGYVFSGKEQGQLIGMAAL
jgi:ribosomal protein S18 acetylase RimI-like enzyme